jgi:hypothetical protein
MRLSTLPSGEARTVARALQTYGCSWPPVAASSSAPRSTSNVIATSSLRSLEATDFEMVAGGSRYTWSDYQCQRTPVTN